MKFESRCYFCGKPIQKFVWVDTISPSGFSIEVASCSECAKGVSE